MNITVYDPNENPDASPDNWHWDAEAYTGVMALHDVQEMEGGNIEVIKRMVCLAEMKDLPVWFLRFAADECRQTGRYCQADRWELQVWNRL